MDQFIFTPLDLCMNKTVVKIFVGIDVTIYFKFVENKTQNILVGGSNVAI